MQASARQQEEVIPVTHNQGLLSIFACEVADVAYCVQGIIHPTADGQAMAVEEVDGELFSPHQHHLLDLCRRHVPTVHFLSRRMAVGVDRIRE